MTSCIHWDFTISLHGIIFLLVQRQKTALQTACTKEIHETIFHRLKELLYSFWLPTKCKSNIVIEAANCLFDVQKWYHVQGKNIRVCAVCGMEFVNCICVWNKNTAKNCIFCSRSSRLLPSGECLLI